MNKLRTRGKTVIAVAVVAALTGLVTWSSAPAGAQQTYEAGHVVAYAWDLDNDGAFDDAVSFATFLKSGEVIADGIKLRVTDTFGVLGNGHGRWRYRQQDKSLFVRTFHALDGGSSDPDPGDAIAFYVITGRLTHTTGGRFDGRATIERFASLADFRAGMPPIWTRTVGFYVDLGGVFDLAS